MIVPSLIASAEAEISFASLLAPHQQQTQRRMAAEAVVVLGAVFAGEHGRHACNPARVPPAFFGHIPIQLFRNSRLVGILQGNYMSYAV